MKTYKYDALTYSGVPISGIVEAHDKNDAVTKIKETCQIVNKLTVVSGTGLLDKLAPKKINEKNLSLLCKQFSIILTAGLPIVRCVELVENQMSDKVLRDLLKEVAGDVAAGYSLAGSFEQRGPRLPTTFIETVRAGEESGALETAFSRLSEYFSKKSKTKSKVVSALAYPAFVMVVAVVVILIIMLYAVPTFTATFQGMGIALPWSTKLLIGMSHFFSKYILLLIGIIAAIILALRIYGKSETGRLKLAEFNLKIPVIGRVRFMTAASQLSNTLSTMLSAGLPILKAVTITGKALDNYYLGKTVTDSAADIELGRRVGESLASSGRFPDLLVEMTSVGEETGSLEETLRVVGDYYDNEVDTATTRAVALLEPIIICFLAVFVVFVLFSVYLPMFSLYSGI